MIEPLHRLQEILTEEELRRLVAALEIVRAFGSGYGTVEIELKNSTVHEVRFGAGLRKTVEKP